MKRIESEMDEHKKETKKNIRKRNNELRHDTLFKVNFKVKKKYLCF